MSMAGLFYGILVTSQKVLVTLYIWQYVVNIIPLPIVLLSLPGVDENIF